MSNFIAELKRRNVLRVALVYGVVAWIVMQVADVMFPALRLPEWTITFVAALLIIGFPLAIAISWAFELTPEGLKPERVAADSDSRPRPIGVPLAGAVIVGVLAAGAWFLLGESQETSSVAQQDEASPEAADDRSIAVLPFVSLSTDEADQFFADGMSEELLNVLTQIGDLKVASRTSSFAFRDQQQDIPAIGQSLNVAHVLEGSVRRSGDRLRITAQLINVADDRHLWSENYDRRSNDLIDIQTDIARRVAGALRSTLVGDDYAPLMDVGTESGEAYRLYLEGREFLNRRGLKVADAISRLEEATSLDPNYARAYTALAVAHLVSANYLRTPTALARSRAISNARRAIELDDQIAEAYAVLGASEIELNNWAEGLRLMAEAEALDATDTTVLQWEAEARLYLGYFRTAQSKIERALDIDPESGILHIIAGNIYHSRGEPEKAKEAYQLAVQYGAAHATLNIGLVELVEGNPQAAALDLAESMYEMQFLSQEEIPAMTEVIMDIVTKRKSVDEAMARFPAFASDEDFLVTMYVYGRETENALRGVEADKDNDKDTFHKIWVNADPEIRQHPYFKTFVANTGLLAHWRQYGWPDLCRPTVGDDFVCD